jgi:4-hydroxy-L-threonine phosphate dehydrogenase PdxA
MNTYQGWTESEEKVQARKARICGDRELLEGALRDAEQLVELTKPDLEEEVRQALESYNQAVNNYRRVKREMQEKREANEAAALRSIRRATWLAITSAAALLVFLLAVIQ